MATESIVEGTSRLPRPVARTVYYLGCLTALPFAFVAPRLLPSTDLGIELALAASVWAFGFGWLLLRPWRVIVSDDAITVAAARLRTSAPPRIHTVASRHGFSYELHGRKWACVRSGRRRIYVVADELAKTLDGGRFIGYGFASDAS